MRRVSGLLYGLLLLQVFLSAGTYVVAKHALGSFSGFELMLLRFSLAAPLFAGLLLALGRPWLPPRSQWGWVVGLGVLGLPLNQGFFLTGLQRTTPTHAGLLYALAPLLIFLISLALRHEHATRWKLAGIALALAGVLTVLLDRGRGDQAEVRLGDAIIFLGVASWALYSTFGRPLAVAHGGLRFTCWTALAGSAVTLPFAPAVVSPAHLWAAPAGAWLAVAYLAVMTSFVSYLLWYYSLERAEASRVSVFANLQPIATALLAWAVSGTPVTGLFAAGTVLVIAGVFLTQRG